MKKITKIILCIVSILVVLCFCWYKVYCTQTIYIVCEDRHIHKQVERTSDKKVIQQLLFAHTTIKGASCPFGYVKIIIKRGDKETILYPATDSCKILKKGNDYIVINDRRWNELQNILEKYGIQKSDLNTGKAI